MTKNHIELFRISTEEYDPFDGKSLDMLRGLIKNCESLYIYKDFDGNIEIVFTKEKETENKSFSENFLKGIK